MEQHYDINIKFLFNLWVAASSLVVRLVKHLPFIKTIGDQSLATAPRVRSVFQWECWKLVYIGKKIPFNQ